jgi:hypothetical protein
MLAIVSARQPASGKFNLLFADSPGAFCLLFGGTKSRAGLGSFQKN